MVYLFFDDTILLFMFKENKVFKIDNNMFVTFIFALICLWLLLPVFVSFYCFIIGALGNFPAGVELTATCHSKVLFFYLNVYRIIGCISVALAFFILVKNLPFLLTKELIKRKPFIVLFGLLLLWSFISTAYSNHPLTSLLGEEVICDGLFTYFVYAAMLILGSMMIDSKYRKRIIILFVSVVTYCSIIMCLQSMRIKFIVYCFPTIRSAMFQNSNYFGYILCMSILALLGLYLYEHNKKIRLIFLLLFIFQTVTLLINDTFGCFLACCFAIPMSYLYYSRKGKIINKSSLIPLFLFFIISVVYNILFSLNFQTLLADIFNIAKQSSNSGDAGSGRWKLWLSTTDRIVKRPIFGYGPEGFNGNEFLPFNGSPHNDILQIAAYLGIPGLIMYIAGFFTLYLYLKDNNSVLSVTTLICMGIITANLASSMFGHPVYTVTPYFWLFTGMALIEKEDSQPLFSLDNKKVDIKKNAFIVLAIVIYTIFCLFAGVRNYKSDNEGTKEFTDLITMKNAKLTAQLMIKNGQIKKNIFYWYDANKYEIISESEKVPAPYGMGTDRVGNGLEEYKNKYDDVFDYNSSIDYTDKIIRVIVDTDNRIDVKWVKK